MDKNPQKLTKQEADGGERVEREVRLMFEPRPDEE
jgi:hypothetical protein